MKKVVSFIIAAVSVAAGPAQAFEFAKEPVASVYIQVPMGKSQTKTPALNSYGFRLDAGQVSSHRSVDLSLSARKPLLDLQYNHEGLQGFYVNGLNALVVKTTYNADTGKTVTTKAIDPGLLVLGVVGGAVIIRGNKKCAITFTDNQPVVLGVGCPL